MDEETLFHLLIEKPAEERRAFLEQTCDGDSDLRQRLEILLQAHEHPATLLQPSPAGSRSYFVLDPPTPLVPSGTVIGRYKLLEPIGEGGYGTVFMAEQTSPVQRKVALKIIKAGMDTRQVIARFEAERQALALMDHPNIAKVFDAGVTDAGRPYFVMELVKGVPITKYCDEHHLNPRQRLELFVQVCHAVQHAHQKGIIHRDLKPSNVLVAQYDGKPAPKVIDFGVAKATGQQLTERTMFTGFGDVVGTLEYMSPEQAELNQLDIDTRSDIYSLGVLLYELLAGSTPLEHKRLREVALLEVLRVVREEEPARPSTRLSTSQELASIAAQRGVEPRELSGLLKGELDWIVMKALEKDRSHRYDTANGLLRDVERYLHDEPVSACPPTARYRFRKFARRNRAVLLTTVMVMTALVLGTAVSAWQAVRATRATRAEREAIKVAQANETAAVENAKRAEAERVRAENYFFKARVAVNNIMTGAAGGKGGWSALPLSSRKIVVDNALRFYDGLFDDENPTEPAVRYETGAALWAIGLVHAELGEFDQAEKLYRRAADVLDSLVRDFPGPVEYRQQCAWCHTLLGGRLRDSSRNTEALTHYQIAAQLYLALLSERPVKLAFVTEATLSFWNVVTLTGAGPATDDLYRQVLAHVDEVCGPLLAQKPLATRPANQAYREAWALDCIASYLLLAPFSAPRDHQLCVTIAARAAELYPAKMDHWETLAIAQYRAGDYEAAQAAIARAIKLKPDLTATGEICLAMTQWRQGKKVEARQHYELAKERRRDTATDFIQREAAELIGVTIEPATRPGA
jgi:tetratricopeptide (TPR) repeat protein